jgi:hypothetical protein
MAWGKMSREEVGWGCRHLKSVVRCLKVEGQVLPRKLEHAQVQCLAPPQQLLHCLRLGVHRGLRLTHETRRHPFGTLSISVVEAAHNRERHITPLPPPLPRSTRDCQVLAAPNRIRQARREAGLLALVRHHEIPGPFSRRCL